MSAPPMMTTVMTAHGSQAGPGGGLAGGHVAGVGGHTAGVSGANVWPAAGVGALGAGVAPSSDIGLAGGVARVGMQVAGGDGAGVPQVGLVEQHPGVGGLTSMKLDISHKPPVMKGSFDLYSVQLRAFLTRLGCWNVVDGSYRLGPQGLISFAARDNAAREAILHGVPAADAEMICQELSAEAMWSRFVDRQTKREYSNYIVTRDEFVSNRYTPDKTIDREMESLRRQLMHYGKQPSDEDFAETFLGHVSRTHRDVVRQFSKHYVVRDGGAVRPVPTATQVMNALRAESALDERVACEEESKSARICSCGKQGRDDSSPQSKKNKTKGKQQKGKGRDMCYDGEVTYNGFEHFQLVQDETSRYLWGFMMHRKEEASEVVLAHVKWVLAQGHKVEVFSSDQGPELFNNKLKFFLEANGIEYTTTNAYSPEENGLVEKMDGVGMSHVRCLLTAANMPWSLWGEAFNFAIEVMNISGSSALGGETPYYRRFSERPDVSTLMTWGCVAFIFTPKVLRKSKLENPGKPGLFASYVEKLLSNRYGKGRHELPTVIPYVRLPVVHPVTRGLKRNSESDDNGQSKRQCCEHHANCGAATGTRSGPTPPVASGAPGRWPVSDIEVPVASTAATATPPTPEGVLQLGGNAPQFEDSYRESGDNGAADSPNRSRMQTAGPPLDRGVSRLVGDQDSHDAAGNEAADGDVEMDDASASFGDPADLLERLTTYEGFIDHDSEDEDDDEANGWRDEDSRAATSFRRSTRIRHEASRAATSFRRSTRIRRPNVRLQDYEIEIPASLVIEAVNALMEPQTVDEALQGPDAAKWIEALEKEYYDLMRNNAWVLVERPKGKKILGSKWVFGRKRNHKGEVVRHRARITIKGCQQEYGVNFWDTYAPVVSHESVKLVLLLALHYGLPCEDVEFVTAFLSGPIGDDVEIYMEMPDYFNDGSGRVCRLLRSLYGLKQAPLIWYKMLDEHLRSCGFKRSKMDNGVYWRVVGGSPIFLTAYVDGR
ncbi:unnamed protein product [Phytophthora fragariaefolia]|uniref:Unnamed protein product n=1 Tax=Phytophthora fragariaefolia TaxID=1490495 RepID=A0A9W6XKL1_9STRA|nr:unnamed protein product [Phytophthora fragariaefolia]